MQQMQYFVSCPLSSNLSVFQVEVWKEAGRKRGLKSPEKQEKKIPLQYAFLCSHGTSGLSAPLLYIDNWYSGTRLGRNQVEPKLVSYFWGGGLNMFKKIKGCYQYLGQILYLFSLTLVPLINR